MKPDMIVIQASIVNAEVIFLGVFAFSAGMQTLKALPVFVWAA